MGQVYSCAYPYTVTNERYETDNIIITSDHYTGKTNYSGTGGNVIDIIFNNRSGICNGYNHTINIIHEFKNNIKISPKHFIINTNMQDKRYATTITLYYYDSDTDTWVQYYTNSTTYTGMTNSWTYHYDFESDVDIDFTTTKLKATIVGNHYSTVAYIDYHFSVDQTSKMVKNKVESVIMQNELFQKVTSNAEIVSD